MRLQFSLSCLLGGWLLFSSSAPASLEPKGTDTPVIEPAGMEGGSDLSVLEGSKGPFAPDDDPADASKDKKPTSLERAKVALAESDAPVLSSHEICTKLIEVAQANALPIGFFTNLIWRESNFDHVAISRVGAMGIAQFMPDVAEKLGLDPFDARDALPASGRLLRTLRARFGNLGLVAAAYNAGPKRVSDWLEQRSGLPKETRDYVSIITGRPAEQWQNVKGETIVFNVSRHVPCHRTEAFSSVEQAERMGQTRKVAEEKRLLEKARETTRRQKKLKARPKATRSVIASRGR